MKRAYVTRMHIIIEILSYVLISACFIIAVIGLWKLPAEIATHYDFAGNPDGYGAPAVLFAMPVIMLLSNLAVSAVIHFMNPASWNMPFKVREEKKIPVYRDMVSMCVCLQLELALYTLVFTVMSYRQKMGGAMLFTVLLMVALFATMIGFCVLSAKHNR